MTFDYSSGIKSILSTNVVESKLKGGQPSDIEFRSLLQSIGLSLFTNPTTILYLEHLSRNYLVKQVSDLSDTLTAYKDQLPRLVKKVDPFSTAKLEEIKKLLTKMRVQNITSRESPLYKQVQVLIEDYQRTTVGPQLTGTVDSLMATSELKQNLVTDINTALINTYEFMGELTQIAQGRDNFKASKYREVLSRILVSKSLSEITDLLSQESIDPVTVATMTSNTNVLLTILGSTPSFTKEVAPEVLVSSLEGEVSGLSDGDPIVLGTGATITVSDNSGSETFSIPATTVDLQNKPHLLFTVDIPTAWDHQYLFVTLRSISEPTKFLLNDPNNGRFHNNDLAGIDADLVDDWAAVDGTHFIKSFKIDMQYPTPVASIDEFVTRVNSTLPTTALQAYKFPTASSSKVLIVLHETTFFDQISCVEMHTEATFIPTSGGLPVIPAYVEVVTFSDNILGYVTFISNRISNAEGTTPVPTLLSAFEELCTKFTAKAVSEGTLTKIEFTGVLTDSDAFLNLYGSFGVGLLEKTSYSFNTSSSLVGLVFPGDTITILGTEVEVSSVSEAYVIITAGMPAVAETTIKVTPALETVAQGVKESLRYCYSVVFPELVKAVNKTERALDSFGLEVSNPMVNTARANLEDVLALLNTVKTEISRNPLSYTSAPTERALSSSIYKSFETKKMDRAIKLLQRLQINELLFLTEDTASYVGQVLQTSSQISQNDIRYPNYAVETHVPIFTRKK